MNSVLSLVTMPLIVSFSLDHFLGASRAIPLPVDKVVHLQAARPIMLVTWRMGPMGAWFGPIDMGPVISLLFGTTMKTLCMSGLMMAMALGCSSEPAASVEEEGFTLLAHDATTLEAIYQSGGASVHATVVERAPNLIEVTYDFGDPIIGFQIDHNQGVGNFMPSGGPLDVTQARLITPLLEEISNLVPARDAERTRVEDMAVRQTSFLQIVPVGEVLMPYRYVAERGWVHISCTCGNQFIGSGFTRVAGMGCGCTGGSGNGCKGRCGQGCGITSFPPCVGTTAYTQDCAKHDYGLGSFTAASDDFSFASNNCSCSGVGTCD